MRLGLRMRVMGQGEWPSVPHGAPWLNEQVEGNAMTTTMLVGAGRAVKEMSVERLERMTLGELLYFALFTRTQRAA